MSIRNNLILTPIVQANVLCATFQTPIRVVKPRASGGSRTSTFAEPPIEKSGAAADQILKHPALWI